MQLSAADKKPPDRETYTEEEIIESAKKDISAFSVLYDKYYTQVFRYLYQRVNTPDEAAEITSQVFLKAMMNLKSFQCRGLPFGSWLYKIARNEMIIAFRKKQAAHVVNITSFDLLRLTDDHQEEEKEERIELIKKALEKLRKQELELIEMHYFEKRPYKEIGEILSMTENNVKVKVFRVIRKLRGIIENRTSR